MHSSNTYAVATVYRKGRLEVEEIALAFHAVSCAEHRKEACGKVFRKTNSKKMDCGGPAANLQAYLADLSQSTCRESCPSPLCHACHSQRGGRTASDNNVPSLALIRVLLSGNPSFQGLHCLHPLTSPPPPSTLPQPLSANDFKALWK